MFIKGAGSIIVAISDYIDILTTIDWLIKNG